jgi:hypothetical protein
MQGSANTLRQRAVGTCSTRSAAARTAPRPTGRREVRGLADRLVVEYAGAVAPGRVIAAVYRAYRLLIAGGTAPGARLDLCEAVVRRQLTDGLALEAWRTRRLDSLAG